MVALLQQGHLRDQFALEESRPEYPMMLIRTKVKNILAGTWLEACVLEGLLSNQVNSTTEVFAVGFLISVSFCSSPWVDAQRMAY